ncbi:MAG: MBL fold metallo-hydrolase [Tenericutes bacterium]|nr:MBL fold metallo-hydrolase [Mycoplasmatota bacterium]
MEVRKIKVGYLEENCYVIEEGKECIVVDPGDDSYLIEKQIGDKTLLGILVTHGHSDHIGALNVMMKKYGVPVYRFDNLQEKKYQLGPFCFQVIYNPGHTKDSISFFFYQYNFMMVGDFIFKNTIGRTDLEGGNIESMMESIRKISLYSKQIRLYPGHGEATTLGDEIQNNYYFKKALENKWK